MCFKDPPRYVLAWCLFSSLVSRVSVVRVKVVDIVRTSLFFQGRRWKLVWLDWECIVNAWDTRIRW